MKKVAINIFAVVLGLVVGSAVNMGLILLGPILIPVPTGVDVTSMESLAKSMHLFETKHFVFPFLAHALGTLVGALVAYVVSSSAANWCASIVGVFFLVGGIANIFMIPAPMWFTMLDVLVAYIPMTWLAVVIAKRCEAIQTT